MKIRSLVFVMVIMFATHQSCLSQGGADSLNNISGFKLKPQKPANIAQVAHPISDLQQVHNEYNSILDLPEKFAARMEQKIRNFNKKLTRSASSYLDKLIRQQQKLQRKLSETDSIAGKKLFSRSIDSLQKLRQQILAGTALASRINVPKDYNAYLDSLGGSLAFLKGAGQYLQKGQSVLKNLNLGSDELTQLKNKLQVTDAIAQYIRERKQVVAGYFSTDKMKAIGGKELQQMSKTVYYYKQQYAEWKEAFSQPEKLESKAMGILRNLPLFKQFMQQHSELAGLLNVPGDYGQSVTGLQTRNDISKQIGQRFGGNESSVQQMIGGQLSAARDELQKFKNKFPNLDGTADMPDFKAASLKTKSFLQRIEYAHDIGFTPHSSFLPTGADIAVHAGYKLNRKGIAGLGISYRAGFGQDINHIHISNQGFGLRSFLDWDLSKSNLHVNGGFEYNYLMALSSGRIAALITGNGQAPGASFINSPWQSSALLGISKKFKIGKRTNKQVMILYDFLHARHFPASEAIKFRLGYSL